MTSQGANFHIRMILSTAAACHIISAHHLLLIVLMVAILIGI